MNKYIELRKHNNQELADIIYYEYWINQKSVIKIASETEVSKGWILKMMNLFKIPRRDLREATTLRMEKEYPK